MTTEEEVRDAVADTLNTISGLRAHAETPGHINPPAVVVIEVDTVFDATMARGSDDFTIRCRMFLGGDLRAAQRRMFSEIAKLKPVVDGNLGGAVDYSRLTRIRGDSEGQVDVGGSTFVVRDFDIEAVG